MSAKINQAQAALAEARADSDRTADRMSAALFASGPDADRMQRDAARDFLAAKASRERAEAALAEAEREDREARQSGGKRPSIRQRAAEMICPECGGAVERKSKHGPTPIFCSPAHRRAFSNRATVNGAGVIAYLKAWRMDRGSGEIAKACFARICTILDSFNEEDRKEGRPRADLYAAKLLADNVQTVDERRYGRRKRAENKAREERETAKEQA